LCSVSYAAHMYCCMPPSLPSKDVTREFILSIAVVKHREDSNNVLISAPTPFVALSNPEALWVKTHAASDGPAAQGPVAAVIAALTPHAQLLFTKLLKLSRCSNCCTGTVQIGSSSPPTATVKSKGKMWMSMFK